MSKSEVKLMSIADLQLLMIVHVLEHVERGRTVGHLLAGIRSLDSNKLYDIHSHCFACCIVCSASKIFIPSSGNKVSNDPKLLMGYCTCG